MALASVAGACREGESQSGSQFLPIPASPFGNQGCNGPIEPLVDPVPVVSNGDQPSISFGPNSQMVAAAGSETLYYTGADGGVHQLDPAGPTDVVLADKAAILVAIRPIMTDPQLSGITILDNDGLVVVDQTSNALLIVSRTPGLPVFVFAGLPSEAPGFADGFANQIRFSFTVPTQVLTTGTGLLYVADPGNHCIRLLTAGPVPVCETVAGTGAPFFQDGELLETGFDTPSGVNVSCGGELLVTELGAAGQGGHRLRSLAVGTRAFFGGFDGTSTTLAGDGTADSIEGPGVMARLDAPVAPVSSEDDPQTPANEAFIFWVDSGTGILRRYDVSTGFADCPLSPGCATEDFAGRTGFSLAITDSGALYVLDGEMGTLYRVTQ